MTPFRLAIHGGAGTILPEDMTPDIERECHAALQAALRAGRKVLQQHGQAHEAVLASIVVLEEFPLFNAGKGSVFAYNGRHSLEASIMDGRNLAAGAVAGLQHVRNPIRLAAKVMQEIDHVMLIGAGAEAFAREMELELVENAWFSTDFRHRQWLHAQANGPDASGQAGWEAQKKFGTVGAVALDVHGNLAAGTSTGGVTNKRYGRVGDSPLIGCGTYAENGLVAVSATGYGEAFIRKAVAHDLLARMKYGRQSLAEAARQLVQEELPAIEGEGGLIAIDQQGHIQLEFNTVGMYRGFATDQELNSYIYAT